MRHVRLGILVWLRADVQPIMYTPVLAKRNVLFLIIKPSGTIS